MLLFVSVIEECRALQFVIEAIVKMVVGAEEEAAGGCGARQHGSELAYINKK